MVELTKRGDGSGLREIETRGAAIPAHSAKLIMQTLLGYYLAFLEVLLCTLHYAAYQNNRRLKIEGELELGRYSAYNRLAKLHILFKEKNTFMHLLKPQREDNFSRLRCHLPSAY